MSIIYALSGITGGGDISGDVYIYHETSTLLSGITSGSSYVVSDITVDQYGHLSAYTLVDLTLNTLSDVINTGTTTDGQLLVYNGTYWTPGVNINDYPTFTYVNTLISGITNYYSGYTNTIDTLYDVNIVSPSNYHILVYNSTLAKWVNINPWTDYYTSAQTNSMFWTSSYTSTLLTSTYSLTSHTHQITNLTDVSISAATNGDILVYDSGYWVNSANTNITALYNYIDSAISAITFSGNTLANLADVSLSTLSVNDLLMYDGSGWTNSSSTLFYTTTQLNGGILDSRYFTSAYTTAMFSNSGHNHYLSNLADVNAVTATEDDMLFISGGTWINKNLYTLCYSISQTNNLTSLTYYYTSAYTNQFFSRTGHTHVFSNITDSASTLANYSLTSHTHSQYLTGFTETDPIWTAEQVYYYTSAQTYTKTEVDALLTGVTTDLSGYYTSAYTNQYFSRTGHTHTTDNITNNSLVSGATLTIALNNLSSATSTPEWELLYETEYSSSSGITSFDVTGSSYTLFRLVIDGEGITKIDNYIYLTLDNLSSNTYNYNYVDNTNTMKFANTASTFILYLFSDAFAFSGDYIITGSFKGNISKSCLIYGKSTSYKSYTSYLVDGTCKDDSTHILNNIKISIDQTVNMKLKLYKKTL